MHTQNKFGSSLATDFMQLPPAALDLTTGRFKMKKNEKSSNAPPNFFFLWFIGYATMGEVSVMPSIEWFEYHVHFMDHKFAPIFWFGHCSMR